jgi:hypothetical protein
MAERSVTDDDLDRLFEAEPPAFVGVRDALVRKLRKEGDREAADEVAKLRKPTAVAWALNQLPRREAGQVEALLRQDEHIRELMQSRASGADLRKATDERREIVRGLARLASAILAGGGHKATATSADKIFETLQAVATDPEAREALRLGRLSGDVRPSGFGDSFGLPAQAGGGGGGSEEALRHAEQLEQLAEARRVVRQRADEAEDLRRTADRLARQAGEAERRAARARKAAERAAADQQRAVAAAEEAAIALARLEDPSGRGP